MYEVRIIDGNRTVTFCRSTSEELAILNPVVSLEINKAGTFEFTITPDHPYYDLIAIRKTPIYVYQNDVLIFDGFAAEIDVDFYRQKRILCEGCLSYFNDSVQRPKTYTNATLKDILTDMIAVHNSQVDSVKQFQLASTPETEYTRIDFQTKYESTFEAITNVCKEYVERPGIIDTWFLRVASPQNETRKIDFIQSPRRFNSQYITLGNNLIDIKLESETDEIASVIIPLGKEVNGQRVTIKSVNNNLDYLESADAIAKYGRVTKSVIFDDVTSPSVLKDKGTVQLARSAKTKATVTVNAFDLSLAGQATSDFRLFDAVLLNDIVHEINATFKIEKITYYLDEPQNNKLNLATVITVDGLSLDDIE